MKTGDVSELTLRRYPRYLHCLRKLKQSGLEYTSANELSRQLAVHETQIRKDLAITGLQGTPKIGHRITDMERAILTYLGWNKLRISFLVGVGNLGSAILGYDFYKETGIQIVAAFDTSEHKIGLAINDISIFGLDSFSKMAKRMKAQIGILTTPSEVAQKVTNLMVESGIKAIWNFTQHPLSVPSDVIVEDVNLYAGLAVLTRKLIAKE
jgi:redox-sensing transcriptional repressor